MKKSFKDAPTEETVEVEVVDTSEVEGEHLPATATPVSLALGSVSGSIDSRDLVLPRLNIVQGVGPLSEHYDSGDLVLNKDTLVAQKDTPVNLTVLSIKKTYEERLPYDPNGPRPKTFETIEQVVDAGFWVDWRNNEPPPVKEVATVLVLLEQPEGLDSMSFSIDVDGKKHAIAIWSLRGTAYVRAAKKIFSANSIELAHTGLLSGFWELFATKETVNGNPIAIPVMKLVGRNKEDRVKKIQNCLG